MTLQESIALQPTWVAWWVNWLFFAAYLLPLTLLPSRKHRVWGLVIVGTSLIAALGIEWLYDEFGYVKLLGLPHVVLWTPLATAMLVALKRQKISRGWPMLVFLIVLGSLLVSLAFDYFDVVRYWLGERNASIGH